MAVVTIQFRRGTAAQWTTANPVLAAGEPGYETDTGKEKRGDGVTAWSSLGYFAGGGGGGGGGAVSSVAGRTGAVTLTSADVGLGSVANTADSAKNVLSATKLTTARNIAGHAFDGTAAISIAASDVGAQPTLIGSGSTATAGVVVVGNGVATPTGLPNGTVVVETA